MQDKARSFSSLCSNCDNHCLNPLVNSLQLNKVVDQLLARVSRYDQDSILSSVFALAVSMNKLFLIFFIGHLDLSLWGN